MKSIIIAAAAAVVVAAPSRGQIVEVQALKDNTLYESPGGLLSNGAGAGIFAGVTAMGGDRRAVLAFDLASAAPAGTVVTSATLRLRMSQTIVGPQPVSAHRLLADWGEGGSSAAQGGGAGANAQTDDATWIHTFFPDQFWANPGGDFAPAASATTTVAGTGFYEWSSPALTADVNAWIESPDENFGWILINEGAGLPTAKRFDSREATVAVNRPVLILDLTPACPTDLSGDGETGSADLNILLSAFGATDLGDVNGDGQTNSEDLNLLLAAFGEPCP